MAVHLAPMISAQAATEQLASWTGFIVRIATPILALRRRWLGVAAASLSSPA